ncbi:MAG TPA: AI-2E family transporter [Micromonosporaceae bacterium]|nr:AI-2E family transporter [Micromonosporaceae bacterium]
MRRFGQLRKRIRQAYQSGRASGPAKNDRASPGRNRSGAQSDSAASDSRLVSDADGGEATSAGGGKPPELVHPSTASRDDADVPHGLRIAAAWSWRLIVIGVLVGTLLTFIWRLKIVAIPLAIALLFSALLAPAVGWLLRARFPRSLATALVLIGGLATVIGTLTLVVTEFINGAPDLARSASQGIQQIQDWLKTGPLNLSDGQLNRYIDEGRKWLDDNTGRLTSGAVDTAATLFEVLTGSLLVLFATFFFLRDGERIWRFLVNLLPSVARHRVDDAGRASWATLVAYVRATVLVAFIDAVGIGIFLVIFDVPLALALAALVFLGAFIPIVGATLSGAVAVLVALVDSGWVTALIIVGVVIGVQQVEGHVLQPLIMGRAVAIHPLAVVLAITAGVVLAGIVGALVSVPLIAVLNTAIRRLARKATGPPPESVVVASKAP